MSSNSTAIPTQLPHLTPNQPCVCIKWDEGKEIRIYHLGPRNVLQEYAYSARKGRNSWHYGDLHDLKIVLDPTSSLAAVRTQRGRIYVYYQDPNDGVVRAIYQERHTKQWRRASRTITTAVKGTSIAVAEWFDANGAPQFNIFYQDSKLRLREYFFDRSEPHWVPGDFNPGVQPRGTPITAETVHGGGVDINVMWRDAQGRVVSRSWSKSSGWDLPNGGRALRDGRD